ncbi:MAG: GyrI-like domain-containing protein [Anaerolineae bacterium]|nr:GyrI-like domain-containing protein [Anaerolineae bacterium]
MIGTPKIDERRELPYAGIRVQVPHTQFPTIIPQLIDEIYAWLGQHGVEGKGPLMRYYVINMSGTMDVELGVEVDSPITGDDRVKAQALPAGRYAWLIYTGIGEKAVQGNGALINWAEESGIKWDRWDDPKGDAFRSRVEFFLDGPQDDPNPDNWRSEVAIKVAD